MVRALCFQCMRLGFDPLLGAKIPHAGYTAKNFFKRIKTGKTGGVDKRVEKHGNPTSASCSIQGSEMQYDQINGLMCRTHQCGFRNE